MKKIVLASSIIFATTLMATELKTESQKISYTIGAQIGASLADTTNSPITIDRSAVFAAINDVLDKKEPQLSEKEMSEAMTAFAKKAQAHAKKQQEEAARANTAEGEKYLAENKAKDGVVVTQSGLQYRVITQGSGKKPAATDTVKVHYKGSLPDGTIFDSSIERGQPAEFPLNAVIKGWTEGLQLMPVGSKYELVIPAELAYGKMAPASIGPNRVLNFEVELLDIIEKKDKK